VRASPFRIRRAVAADAAAIARTHSDNAAYYAGLAPDLFRRPDEDGLVEFVEPTPADSGSTDEDGRQPSSPRVNVGLGVVSGSRCSSESRRIEVPVVRNSVACSPHTWL